MPTIDYELIYKDCVSKVQNIFGSDNNISEGNEAFIVDYFRDKFTQKPKMQEGAYREQVEAFAKLAATDTEFRNIFLSDSPNLKLIKDNLIKAIYQQVLTKPSILKDNQTIQ